MKNELIKTFENGGIKIDVTIDPGSGTIWLSQAQIAELYQTTVQNVIYHLKNAFSEGILDPESVVKCRLHTASDGKNYEVKHYNLEAIFEVGIRGKSPVCRSFHRWALKVLTEVATTGSYNAVPYARDPSYQIMNPVERAKKWIEETEYTIGLEAQVVELMPKADAWEAFVHSGKHASYRQFCNAAQIPERQFFIWADGKFLYRDADQNWIPYAEYQKAGYFNVKAVVCKNGYTGFRGTVTPTGMMFLRDQWNKSHNGFGLAKFPAVNEEGVAWQN
ncbi:hypothetical protein FACS1894164_12150 [Spirochaetia bacterium]|nr:hypothetical protein FACS1894164_12150 [Spirochaetia bacterium]